MTSMLPNPKVNFVFSFQLNISHNRPFATLPFFDSQEITLLLFLLHTFNLFSAFFCLLFLLSQSLNVGGPKTQVLGPLSCVSFPWLHQVLRFQIPPLCPWIPNLFFPAWTSLFHSRQVSPLPTCYSHQDVVADRRDSVMLANDDLESQYITKKVCFSLM